MMTSMGFLLPGVFAVAVMFGPGTDTTFAQRPGYGGVLPIPFAADEASMLLSPAEIIAPRHTERRSGGRVLYSNDRASKAVQTEPVQTARVKRIVSPCTTSLLPSRTSAQPNS
jgi:hypothetical protein